MDDTGNLLLASFLIFLIIVPSYLFKPPTGVELKTKTKAN